MPDKNPITELQELFTYLPGIGERQARRFVYYLLKNPHLIPQFVQTLPNLKKNIIQCSQSFQYFFSHRDDQTLSPIELDRNRDSSTLLVVEKDYDIEAMEKSGVYNGKYFVLGGIVPFLEKNPEKKIRLQELVASIEKRAKEGLKEVIFALSATPESEHTEEIIKKALEESFEKHNLKVSHLGRGFSTGTELEYSDTETIKNALKSRT